MSKICCDRWISAIIMLFRYQRLISKKRSHLEAYIIQAADRVVRPDRQTNIMTGTCVCIVYFLDHLTNPVRVFYYRWTWWLYDVYTNLKLPYTFDILVYFFFVFLYVWIILFGCTQRYLMRCDFNYIRLELYENVFANVFKQFYCWMVCVIVCQYCLVWTAYKWFYLNVFNISVFCP